MSKTPLVPSRSCNGHYASHHTSCQLTNNTAFLKYIKHVLLLLELHTTNLQPQILRFEVVGVHELFTSSGSDTCPCCELLQKCLNSSLPETACTCSWTTLVMSLRQGMDRVQSQISWTGTILYLIHLVWPWRDRLMMRYIIEKRQEATSSCWFWAE